VGPGVGEAIGDPSVGPNTGAADVWSGSGIGVGLRVGVGVGAGVGVSVGVGVGTGTWVGVGVAMTITGFGVRSGRGWGDSVGTRAYVIGVGVILGVRTGLISGVAVALVAAVSDGEGKVEGVPQARAPKTANPATAIKSFIPYAGSNPLG